MCVYRLGGASSWTTLMKQGNYEQKQADYAKAMEKMYRGFDRETGGRFQETVERAILRLVFLTRVNTKKYEEVLDPRNWEFFREANLRTRFFIRFEAGAPGDLPEASELVSQKWITEDDRSEIVAETEMKQKVAKGLFWKLLENGGAQGVQFVIAILLARLLTPAEYGVVGIIMIFITIANVFVQSGFSTALVQKRKADEVDFSSVCYFELAAALGVYGLLYGAAPSIADFYGLPVLCDIVRVLGVVLFPGAVISVQTAYVSRNMEFRGLFFSTLAASLVSGGLSIAMAAAGWGVWAMVGQQISYYISLMAVLFLTVSWKPRRCFSMGTGGRNVFLWLEAFVCLPFGYSF